MKALSLTQPWATLIAVGAKRIETRSWGTNFHGQIAIHAAKGLGPVGGKRGLADQCTEPAFAEALRCAGYALSGDVSYVGDKPLPLGAIVALAVLDRVSRIDMRLRAQVIVQTVTPLEIEFGNYDNGRYAWFLENILQLNEPVPCQGALGLWDVPADVQRRITAQLESEVVPT